jgi:hypothetical protein
MKIVRLNAENVKRIKAVEITPDGAVQIVAGRNAQGKSSVLDSIWMALEWRASGKATPRPIRDGEDTARVRLDLGDIVVTRKWAGDKTTLLVEAADGAVYQRPQEMLDALVGGLSFDPLAFTQQGAREQVQTLLGLVDLPFDPADLDAQRQALFDRRHVVGQDKARAKGALESMLAPAAGVPGEEVSSSGIVAELTAAQKQTMDNEGVRSAAVHARMRVEQAQVYETSAIADVEEAREALQSAEASLESAAADVREAVKLATGADERVTALAPDPDLTTFSARLAAVEETNRGVREARAYLEKKSALAEVDKQYVALTAQIDALDKKKADGLAAATFPIEGLSFGEGGVTYNGVPFCQSSSGEQLKVSLALAMAMNPTLRVIRITDGSLLDSENMALIEKMATDADFQVWVERVGDADQVGVVIEDGQVRA